MPRGAPAASTSAPGAVTPREVAALVYNYLRSNGFVEVRGLTVVTRSCDPRIV